jgi:acyl carrier protein
LHAFVVPQRPAGVAADALREALAEELPTYMVPAAISVLTELPLTGNGKVDRRTLTERASHHEPDAVAADPADEPAGQADRLGPLTEVICACVADVLGLDEVGPSDNFFRLGGDSLSGTRLAGRLRELLGIDVPIRTVFEHPDLSDLAGQVAGNPVSGPTALSVAELLLGLEDEPGQGDSRRGQDVAEGGASR